MRVVYEIDSGKRVELLKILEENPYSKPSFAVNGYKLKDGKAVGGDEGKIYLYLKGPDSFLPFAEEKLKGIAKRAPVELEKKIAGQLDAEEDSAASGFGEIFG